MSHMNQETTKHGLPCDKATESTLPKDETRADEVGTLLFDRTEFERMTKLTTSEIDALSKTALRLADSLESIPINSTIDGMLRAVNACLQEVLKIANRANDALKVADFVVYTGLAELYGDPRGIYVSPFSQGVIKAPAT